MSDQLLMCECYYYRLEIVVKPTKYCNGEMRPELDFRKSVLMLSFV